MKSSIKYLINTFILILFLIPALSADPLEQMLKQDFTAQQTIKIRFEVNKRLYSFQAGKFRLEKVKKNRDKIRRITERIVPWSIMEKLDPPEVARIIEYMYHADEAGAKFLDAEDLIPLVAKVDIPLKDFVLMVQYNSETKNAGIPEEIRQSFLGEAVSKGWDGASILAGGRGLVLARSAKIDINKTASLLLKSIPAKGARINPQKMVSIIQTIVGEPAKEKNAQVIMYNLAEAHKAVAVRENSPQILKNIVHSASSADSNIQLVSKVTIPAKPKTNRRIEKEKGIIPETQERTFSKTSSNWQVLSKSKLRGTIKPWLGTPYKFGGKTGRGGIDCSGFTRIVLIHKNIGVPSELIGHGTSRQRKTGRSVKKKNLRAGDLVFFSASPNRSKITHVGIVTSPTTFSHACSKGVINDKLSSKWWRKRYVLARRIFIDTTN